jgi:hypothetical protein
VGKVGERMQGLLRRADLLTRRPASGLEAAVVGFLLFGLGLGVYGPHVLRGEFLLDDWMFRADYERYGWWGLMERLLHIKPGLSATGANGRSRIVSMLYHATNHAVFGSHPALHLVTALLLGVVMSLLLFLVLRKLRIERLHAAFIAGLVLVFPAADATRLWPAAATAQLAIALFLAGLLVALEGLERTGRSAVIRHGAAVALYVLALLTYEYPFAGIALAVFIYRVKAPWRRSIRLWLIDVGVAALLAGYARLSASQVDPFSDQIDTAREIQSQARTLLSRLGIPEGQALLPLKLLALFVLVAVALALFLRPTDVLRRDLQHWLLIAAVGVVGISVGYVVLVPLQGRFPLSPGFGNRINIGAAIGWAIFMYSLAVLLGIVVVRALSAVRTVPQARAWSVGLGVFFALVLASAWTNAVVDDRRAWDRASALTRQTLDVLAEMPQPPHSSTVYTFGMPGETAPGVRTFAAPWDLIGAVRVQRDDHTLRGIPSPNLEKGFWPDNAGDNWGISCTSSSVIPHGYGYASRSAARYGAVVFVDVPNRSSTVVRSRGECREWASRYGLLRP